LNIHEYQAKALLRQYGVPLPEGRVVHNDAHAMAAAEEIGGERWVVKAQIHAGGRGKAGGVRVVDSIERVRQAADGLIGRHLVTPQTGPGGRLVQRVLVEQAHTVIREYYLGLLVNRAEQRITVVASAAGGMDIEQVARTEPHRLVRETVDPAVGLQEFQCRKIAARVGLTGRLMSPAVRLMKRLYRCFRDKDCLLAEINPLAVVTGNQLMALDAKMSFDGNALYRLPEVADLRDFEEEDPKEVEASGHGLNYIALDGNVGCIVNGAGLAMATMDAIALRGGRPANFLDVGGGASPEKIANAFRIVLEDANVRVILLNIFAGINRCDWVADGIVRALRDQQIRVPVVVRLAGTNLEAGRRILVEAGLAYLPAENLNDAAEKAVKALGGVA
jgi:succinyl-CoA synthetase beta subunit